MRAQPHKLLLEAEDALRPDQKGFLHIFEGDFAGVRSPRPTRWSMTSTNSRLRSIW